MFDIGWIELLVIGVVALIVVGPEDLPSMFKKLGQFTAKVRNMAREFGRAMEDAADASGVKEAAKDLNSLRNMGSPMNVGKKAMGLDDMGFDDDFDDDAPAPKPKAGDPSLSKTPLSEDRAEKAKKMSDAMADAATKRHEAEAKAKAAAETKAAESDAT